MYAAQAYNLLEPLTLAISKARGLTTEIWPSFQKGIKPS
jgi:hypothetical protein